jgi:ribosomal protein L30E
MSLTVCHIMAKFGHDLGNLFQIFPCNDAIIILFASMYMLARLGTLHYIITCSSFLKSIINGCRTASIRYFLMYKSCINRGAGLTLKMIYIMAGCCPMCSKMLLKYYTVAQNYITVFIMYCTKHNLCRVYEKVCTFSYTLYKSKIFQTVIFLMCKGAWF